MTKTEIRKEFDSLASKLRAAGHQDAAARAEVLREWFTNEDFRKALAGYSFKANA